MDDGTLPADLVAGLEVQSATPVSGGDIARAYRLETPHGPLFAKTHPTPSPGMFEREAAGLRALREHAPAELGVPQVLRESSRGLVLEWIDEGSMPSRPTEVALGRALAHLHGAGSRTGRTTFGGLGEGSDGDSHGYLGSVAVDLTPTDNWAEFYLHRRLEPLVTRAVGEGRLDPAAIDILSELEPRTGRRLLTRGMVDAAHRQGAVVHVWTINERPDMERLIDLGVDGIVTDNLATLKAVLVERDLWEGHA